jgi:hypothetical protein
MDESNFSRESIPQGVVEYARVSIIQDMEIFDTLPPEIRRALRETPVPFSAGQISGLLGNFPESVIIGLIKDNVNRIQASYRAKMGLRPK